MEYSVLAVAARDESFWWLLLRPVGPMEDVVALPTSGETRVCWNRCSLDPSATRANNMSTGIVLRKVNLMTGVYAPGMGCTLEMKRSSFSSSTHEEKKAARENSGGHNASTSKSESLRWTPSR